MLSQETLDSCQFQGNNVIGVNGYFGRSLDVFQHRISAGIGQLSAQITQWLDLIFTYITHYFIRSQVESLLTGYYDNI